MENNHTWSVALNYIFSTIAHCYFDWAKRRPPMVHGLHPFPSTQRFLSAWYVQCARRRPMRTIRDQICALHPESENNKSLFPNICGEAPILRMFCCGAWKGWTCGKHRDLVGIRGNKAWYGKIDVWCEELMPGVQWWKRVHLLDISKKRATYTWNYLFMKVISLPLKSSGVQN